MTKRIDPFWMADSSAVPCPRWCTGNHDHDIDPGDRTHMSKWVHTLQPVLVDPTTVDGETYPTKVEVFLEQRWRETEPRVAIIPVFATSPLGKGMELTLTEAVALRDALDKAIRKADRR